MWAENWRDTLWQQIDEPDRPWDLIVIGGGITGAGLMREAARVGARVLLIERDDFASGTSSWSSKLVHGGLRYLAQGEWRLTLESVRERQAMMKAAPGLVDPLNFLLPMYRGSKPGRLMMGAALTAYDLMAGKRYSRYLGADRFTRRMSALRASELRGGFAYMDARTDDVRLVLRVLSEGLADGGQAANYLGAESLLFEGDRVAGVTVRDRVNGRSGELRARAVVNAAGPWVDALREQAGGEPRIRPLRGSHLLFRAEQLPLTEALTLFHPRDNRPLFAFPWEGVTLFGTTDLDHPDWPANPARMTPQEAAYLEEALAHYFPLHPLKSSDALSAFSGIRPVVNTGAASPSEESREHALWAEKGLLTVSGGKLTTFRGTALEALRKLADQVPALADVNDESPVLGQAPQVKAGLQRMAGRLGADYEAAAKTFDTSQIITGTVYRWAELQWAVRHEAVETLADLMLRRTRLGLLLPQGGRDLLDQVGGLCRRELGWDVTRWEKERRRYISHWQEAHRPPVAA
ncbi:MAG: FAD-dependent oxidoreductase [Salinisphaeraceae bacterium]|nr:FAD-dependent oxidoreductase [Salinisphaeraceae bacterium]